MSDFVTLTTFFDRIEAELAKSLLEANDIPSMVMADDGGGMRPSLLTATGGVRLIVRTEDAVQAAEVLQTGMSMDENPETED